GCTFTISNNCPHPIWPGTLAGAGTPQLPTTGFRLDSGQTARIRGPPGGIGALPPVTLFEITLGKGLDEDYYDISLVDGYNLPVVAAPRVLHGGCNATGCLADLNRGCPKELRVDGGGGVVACKSACEAFGLDEYCCSGEYANPTSCKPSFYSTIFKAACPRAYSYAFDDGTSTFTGKAYDYTIVFCANVNRSSLIQAKHASVGLWKVCPDDIVNDLLLSNCHLNIIPHKSISGSGLNLYTICTG
ncbi:hypothetical protein BHE74_00011956, partial [Ensete ventricosum]